MAISYYNPNQQVTRPGKSYEGTKSWYERARDAGPATQPAPRDGGAPGSGSGIREQFQGGSTFPGGGPNKPPRDYRDLPGMGRGGGAPGREFTGTRENRGGGMAYPGGVVDPNAPGAGNVYGGFKGGTAGGPVADLARELQGGFAGQPGVQDLVGQMTGQQTMRSTKAPMDLAGALGDSRYSGPAGRLGATGYGPEEGVSTLANALIGGAPAPTMQRRPRSDAFGNAEHDARLVATGEMSPDEYAEKWGVSMRDALGAAIDRARETIGDYPPIEIDTGNIKTTNPYQEEIDALLAGLDQNYSDQEAHALSVNEAEKQKALNDMAGLLGARGVGSSPAALMPGASDIAAQFAGQSADIVSDVQQRQTADQLQQLATLGQMAEAQGNMELKAAIENEANRLKAEQMGTDIESVRLQQKQGVADANKQTIEDLETLLDDPQIRGEERTNIAAALQEFYNAMADPEVTASELQALAARLLGLLARNQRR